MVLLSARAVEVLPMIILIADIVSYVIRKISLFLFLYFCLKITQQNKKNPLTLKNSLPLHCIIP